MTHHTKTPPAKPTSTAFIANSIAIIEMKDIPIAVLKASGKFIWRDNIKVSSMIDVISPLIIARLIIHKRGKGIWVIWKKKIVPKSPIEHPSRHQSVLTDAFFQVDLQVQDIDSAVDILIIQPYFILPLRNLWLYQF